MARQGWPGPPKSAIRGPSQGSGRSLVLTAQGPHGRPGFLATLRGGTLLNYIRAKILAGKKWPGVKFCPAGLREFSGGPSPDFAKNPGQTQAALGGGVPAWDARGTGGTDPLGGNHRCVTRL